MKNQLKRIGRVLFMVVFAHLVQGNILRYFEVFDVVPNLYISIIAISTVAYSRFFAFGVAATIAIITESTLAGLPGLNIVFYPSIGFLASIFFGDKSERRLEQEIAAGKLGKNLSPHLRTLLSATFLIFVYELVHLVYIYLSQGALPISMGIRGLWSIGYTVGLTALIMVPLRYFIGVYKALLKKQQEKKEPSPYDVKNR